MKDWVHVLLIVLTVITFVLIASLLIIIETETMDSRLDLCKTKGYEGIIDKGVLVNEEWHCYKYVDGFIEISPEIE